MSLRKCVTGCTASTSRRSASEIASMLGDLAHEGLRLMTSEKQA